MLPEIQNGVKEMREGEEVEWQGSLDCRQMEAESGEGQSAITTPAAMMTSESICIDQQLYVSPI